MKLLWNAKKKNQSNFNKILAKISSNFCLVNWLLTIYIPPIYIIDVIMVSCCCSPEPYPHNYGENKYLNGGGHEQHYPSGVHYDEW